MPQPRILYIEDSEDNRTLVKRVLAFEEMEVLEAADGETGLRMAKTSTPDLILMDINLPAVDGYELTVIIKSMPQLEHIPVVALTANVMKGDRERTIAAGCDGYIQKPIDVDSLPDQIRKYLKER